MTDDIRRDEDRPPACRACLEPGTMTLRMVKNGYRLFFCRSCGFGTVHPLPPPTDLASIYGADYFRRGNKYGIDDGGAPPELAINEMQRVGILRALKTGGSLLDAGSGPGTFLAAARDAGYSVTGLDISPAAVAFGRERYGLDILQGDLCTPPPRLGPFDIITFWDAIEHVTDAEQALRNAGSLVKPDGVLLISTGDAASGWARLAGRFWQLLTPPQHVSFFTPASISNMLGRAGMEVMDITHHGKRVSVEFVLFKLREHLGHCFAPVQALARILRLGRIILRINTGDMMTITSRRKSPA